MSQVDEGEVARVMQALPDVLADEELVVQRTLPHLSPADVLDTALKRSLVRMRYELNQESFEFLRWKVSSARSESQRLHSASTHARDTAQNTVAFARSMRSDVRGAYGRGPIRTFKSEHGVLWTVGALATPTPAGPRRATCLVFSSEEDVLCVWDYPDDWCDLDDAALNELRLAR